jgi:hypothetical protein
MRIRSTLLIGLWGLVLTGLSAPLTAETWQGNLQGGGVVQIDPLTHKPTVYYNGGSSLLWDGAHEMADGSVIIVRDGVAVPDESMYSTWNREAPQELADAAPDCEKLVRKVCGFHSECSGGRACYLAQELSRLEKSELRGTPAGMMAPSTVECQKGLSDTAMFPACDKASEKTATPCIKLVVKVCGDQGQCSDAPACEPSRQLLVMERGERLESKDPDALTESGLQCKEALGNKFFKACK